MKTITKDKTKVYYNDDFIAVDRYFYDLGGQNPPSEHIILNNENKPIAIIWSYIPTHITVKPIRSYKECIQFFGGIVDKNIKARPAGETAELVRYFNEG